MKANIVVCQQCGAKVKENRPDRHIRKVHKSIAPVRKECKNVLWKGSLMRYANFVEIREYVDACLEDACLEESKEKLLTSDAGLLLDLIDELASTFPEIQRPPDFPDYLPPPESIFLEWSELDAEMRDQYSKAREEYALIYGKVFEGIAKLNFKLEILERLKLDIERKSVNGLIIRTVNWTILPPDSDQFEELKRYYSVFEATRPDIRVDYDRIKKALSLKPSSIYRGRAEFSGYCVYLFHMVKGAVLECPVVGNAIYVIEGDWRQLSKMTKSQLLTNQRERVARIVHAGNWFFSLREHIKRLRKVKTRKRRDRERLPIVEYRSGRDVV